jgi:cytochrome c oxidase cbb3-type subunit 2
MRPHSTASIAQSAACLLEGWQGIGLIAATYIYFLIFAQFGLIQRLAELNIRDQALKPVLGLMALGGIAASLLAPRIRALASPRRRLQGAQIGCAAAALLACAEMNYAVACAVSLLTGISLGLLRVTLVANVPLWLGARLALLKTGLAVGIGYFICNLPVLFTATPRHTALVSALLTLAAVPLTFARLNAPPPAPSPLTAVPQSGPETLSFGWILLIFTALIWFDSAAFFIIQNTQLLKAGTWSGNAHLYQNAFVHLIAALAAGWLMMKRGAAPVLGLGFSLLSAACLLLSGSATIRIAAALYPAGVSLYSAALVAFPAFLSSAASQEDRARQAGWLYSIAGWSGSALGIGMAQNLHTVPWQFIAGAALLAALPLMKQFSPPARTQILAIAAVLIAAAGINRILADNEKTPAAASAIARGRRVYLSEGCINCHSQYLRPGAYDNELWGPASDLAAVRREQPPLIGNRRQGPDLNNVGLRRSRQWLRIHFLDPRSVSHDSPMPGYSYLFRDPRGDDLIAYLESLQTPGAAAERESMRAHWTPKTAPINPPQEFDEGRRLFNRVCATCHEAGGKARWFSGFKRLPPDLSASPLLHLSLDAPEPQLRLQIARIIKFGIPGTDMPGHEYLTDEEILALQEFVYAGKLARRLR